MTIKARKVSIILLLLAFISVYVAYLTIPHTIWIWILIMLVVLLAAKYIGDIDGKKGHDFMTSKWYRIVVVLTLILSFVIAYNIDLPNDIIIFPFYNNILIDIIIYTARIFRYEQTDNV